LEKVKRKLNQLQKKMSSSYLGRKDLSRGIRNNNPGNLVYTVNTWLGKIPYSKNTDSGKKFEQFESMSYGIRAMLRNLVNHIDGGENTVRKLITTYAPPFENDTELYIKQVCNTIGVKPDDVITCVNSDFLFLLAKAIVKKENGQDSKYVKDSDIKEAIKNLGTFKTSNLIVDVSKKVNIAFFIGVLLFCYTVFAVSV